MASFCVRRIDGLIVCGAVAEGPRLLAEGSLVRIQAQLGTMKRMTQVPTPC